MTVIWAWLVGLITEILKKFQGLAQITAFLNIPKGCSSAVPTPPGCVKKTPNLGQTLEFLRDFRYNY